MSATLESTLRLDIAHMQSALAKARGEVKRFKDAAKREGGGLGKDLFGGMGAEIKGMLPALGFAAVVGGLKEAMGGMDDLADAALRLGESTESIQRVEHASKLLASVDIAGVTKGFERLERALGDVGNENASEALANLGVSSAALSRMPLEEKILTLADAYEKARSSGTGYNDLIELMGRSAGELIPLLTAGREGIQEMFDGAAVINDGGLQRLAALNDATDAWLAKARLAPAALLAMGTGMAEMMGGAKFEDVFSDKGGGDNQADRDSKAAEREALAVAAQAAEVAERQVKIDEERAKLAEKVAALQAEAHKTRIDALPPEERLAELMKLQDEKLQDMHLHGGQFFAATVEGLQALADAQEKMGNLEGAEKTLQGLKEVVALQQQSQALQESMRNDAANASEAQAKAAQEAREALANAKAQTADVGANDPERLAKAEAKLQEINAQIEAGRRAGKDTLDAELQRESVLQTILGLKRSITEEARQEAELQSRQNSALADLQAELDILRETEAGNHRKAQAMREQKELAEMQKRIMEQTGVSEAEALKMAQETVRLKKSIAEDGGGGGGGGGGSRRRGRINAHIEGGAEGARQRAQERIDESRERVNRSRDRGPNSLDSYQESQKTPLKDTFQFPGLDAYNEQQKTPLKDTFKFPGLDDMARKNAEKDSPLADQAKSNEKAADAKPQDASSVASNLVVELLPQILAALNA